MKGWNLPTDVFLKLEFMRQKHGSRIEWKKIRSIWLIWVDSCVLVEVCRCILLRTCLLSIVICVQNCTGCFPARTIQAALPADLSGVLQAGWNSTWLHENVIDHQLCNHSCAPAQGCNPLDTVTRFTETAPILVSLCQLILVFSLFT